MNLTAVVIFSGNAGSHICPFKKTLFMRNTLKLSLFIISLVTLVSCGKDENVPVQDDVKVIKASGIIHDKVDAFRSILGDPLNNTPGATGGRREVNWDGLPDIIVGFPLPGNLFNPVGPGVSPDLQRGLAYSSEGEFRVSQNGFAEVDPELPSQFNSYSGTKLFANISANDWEIEFEVPGQAVAASVKGFGAVFTDVDLPNSTSLEFFNNDRSLGKFFVPERKAGSSHSFLGVYFETDYITKVVVSHTGRIADGIKDISLGGTVDLVALDDFLYDEPSVR